MLERLRMVNNLFYTIFRVICFLVFMGVVIRECYKKLFPYLVDLYHRYKKMLVDKALVREKIIKQKEMLLNQIEQQRVEGIRLTEKIRIWAEVEHRCKNQKNQEEYVSKEKLRDYMIEQARFLAVANARKELMPEIVSRVADEIKKEYRLAEAQKKYTATIFATLERL